VFQAYYTKAITFLVLSVDSNMPGTSKRKKKIDHRSLSTPQDEPKKETSSVDSSTSNLSAVGDSKDALKSSRTKKQKTTTLANSSSNTTEANQKIEKECNKPLKNEPKVEQTAQAVSAPSMVESTTEINVPNAPTKPCSTEETSLPETVTTTKKPKKKKRKKKTTDLEASKKARLESPSNPPASDVIPLTDNKQSTMKETESTKQEVACESNLQHTTETTRNRKKKKKKNKSENQVEATVQSVGVAQGTTSNVNNNDDALTAPLPTTSQPSTSLKQQKVSSFESRPCPKRPIVVNVSSPLSLTLASSQSFAPSPTMESLISEKDHRIKVLEQMIEKNQEIINMYKEKEREVSVVNRYQMQAVSEQKAIDPPKRMVEVVDADTQTETQTQTNQPSAQDETQLAIVEKTIEELRIKLSNTEQGMASLQANIQKMKTGNYLTQNILQV
jgi:hypothetical protein